MTLDDVLHEAYDILSAAAVETPSLDSTVLLAETLHITKEKLFASLLDEIAPDAYHRFRASIDKRRSGIPVSYIIGRKEFYGFEFAVDERVLVPRPDTETVIECVLEFAGAGASFATILDLCTGSGCIAITLKKYLPHAAVTASDVSADALAVASLNAERILGRALDTVQSNLFDTVYGMFDCIVSNPPYIGSEEVRGMKQGGWPEPAIALDGGETGIELSERIVRNASEHLTPGGWLVLESAPGLVPGIRAAFEREGYSGVCVRKDLEGRDRVVAGRHG